MDVGGGLKIDPRDLPGIGGPQRRERSPLGAGLANVGGALRYGLPYALEQRWGTLSPEDEAEYQAGQRATAARVNKLLPGGAPTAGDWWDGKSSFARMLWENIAFSAPQMGASLGAAAATRGKLALPAAAAVNVPIFAGMNVDRATNSGQTPLTLQQANRSLLAALPQAASDVLVERYLPFAGKIFGEAAAKQGGGILARTAKSIGKAAVVEGVTETGQQALERFAATLPLVSPEATREYVQAFTTSMFVGGALGSLGGIRNKNAAEVDNKELEEEVDSGLNPLLRLTDSRWAFADAAGRTVVGSDGGDVLRATPPQADIPQTEPALPSPGDINRAAAPGATINVDPQGVATEGVVGTLPTEGPWRPMKDAPENELIAMVEARKRKEATGQDVGDELARIADLADEELAYRLDEPAAPTFEQKLEDAKAGLKRNSFVAKLKATSQEELEDTVYDQLIGGDTRAGTEKLAQRIGIVDDKMQPTKLGEQVAARREVAAQEAQAQEAQKAQAQAKIQAARTENLVNQLEPAERQQLAETYQQDLPTGKPDPKLPARLEALKAAVRAAPDVAALDAVNEQDLERQVYRALGGQDVSAGMESVAQKLGILDAKKRLTEKGKFYAEQDPIDFDTAANAALAAGYTGADASSFMQGAANYLGAPAKLNLSDYAAFVAGKEWAEQHNQVPRVADAYVSKKILKDRNKRVTSITLTPEQRQQKGLNSAIDSIASNENLKPSTVTALKRMVKEGAPAAEVDEALQAARGGMQLFQQGPRKRHDYKGETLTRGAPRGKVDPVTREVRTRRSQRAESAQAVHEYRAKKLRARIDEAFSNGDITQRDTIALNHDLITGKFDKANNFLDGQRAEGERDGIDVLANQAERGIVKEQNRVARREFVQGAAAIIASAAAVDIRPAKAGVALKQGDRLRGLLENGDITGALAHIAAKSNRPIYRLIARKLALGDWTGVQLITANDFGGLEGTTELLADGTSEIILYGTGINEETFLHEAIHAYIQQYWAGVSLYMARNKQIIGDTIDRNDEMITRFQEIWDHIGTAIKTTNPELVANKAWAQWSEMDPDEMLSWVLTNAEAQAYLKTIDRDGKKVSNEKSLWREIVDFVRDLFGLPPSKGVTTALDEIMSAGLQLLDVGKDHAPRVYGRTFMEHRGRSRANRQMSQMETLNREEAGDKVVNQKNSGPVRTAAEATDRVKSWITQADTARAALERAPGLKSAARKLLLGWASITHMATHYAQQFPQLQKYVAAQNMRRAIQARFAQLFEKPQLAWERLHNGSKADREIAELIGKLMAYTEFSIDPQRDWAHHKHLHNEPNAGHLKQLVAKANSEFNQIKRKGHAKIYNDYRAINETTYNATMAMSLYNMVAADPVLSQELPGFDINPVIAFNRKSALHEDAESARAYWDTVLSEQVKAASEYVRRFRGGELDLERKQQSSINNRLSPIELRLQAITESRAAMAQSPYFHLGRFGDHFVAFTMRLDPKTKQVDRRAVEAVAQRLREKGYDNIQISADTTKPNVFIRVDNEGQRRALWAAVQELESEGYTDSSKDIRQGVRGDGTEQRELNPAWLENYIRALQADDTLEDETRDRMVSQARTLWLNMLPDSSLSKVMVQRNAVPGFSNDMMRNFAFRHQVATNAVANLSVAGDINKAFTEMIAARNDAQIAKDGKNVDLITDIYNEVSLRESQRGAIEGRDWVDSVRAVNHAFFLGFSPSYVAINTTQMGVLLWPELSKKYGFVESARAMAKVTPIAFAIMRETLAQGRKLGPKRAADAVIAADVLKAAKLSERDQEFVMRMLASGTIDIGGAARELGRAADDTINSKTDTALRYAASFGLYSETFTRLVAAMSARELHGGHGDAAVAYAQDVVTQSMLNYSTWNTARQTGKMAFFGKFTPVMFSFMTYQFQVMEKMYREVHTAFFNNAKTAQEKKEAVRFLGSHLAAIVTLTGTLGMPIATVFAAVAEKLVDLFDDDEEPYDITVAYRNFLADSVGEGFGEVLARGLPRAFGLDISSRAGEQDLIPGSGMLTERRKWDDASGDWALKAMGAPVSMVRNIFKGIGQAQDGDLFGGMITMVPTAIRGPAQAARMMTSDGYIDGKGNKLPMTPGAAAILAQALGFTPAAKAEYSEAKGDQAARRTSLTARATVLRNNIVRAVENKDFDRARNWIADARRFDRANPAFSVMDDIEPALKRRARVQAIAQATSTPIGVSMKDLQATAISRYANVDYTAR